jgi:predicted MFS family arabinose efflux permease
MSMTSILQRSKVYILFHLISSGSSCYIKFNLLALATIPARQFLCSIASCLYPESSQLKQVNLSSPEIESIHYLAMNFVKNHHEADSEWVVERNQTEKPTPLPDVGLMPWLQVLGGFFLMFNSWGVLFTWGVLQSYFENGGLKDSSSPSSIAWVGSLQSFLLLFAGSLTAKFIDAGHYRSVGWLGVFLLVFGLMMGSLADRLYQVVLSLGICVGLGISMFLVMSIAVIPTWFVKHRGLAMGIVTSGTSIGGIVLPIMLQRLIAEIGYGWALRVYGFITVGTLIPSILIVRPRLPPRPRARLLEYPALKKPEFALYTLGYFVTFLGIFVLYTFIVEWLIKSQIDTKGLDPFYILVISNAGGLFGRLLPGIMADYWGGLNVQIPHYILAGVLVLCWIPVKNIGGVITIAILYGYVTGAIFGIPALAVASMTENLATLPGRLAVLFMAVGIASLIGNPISGAIVQRQNGSFDGARIYAGVVILVGAALVIASRIVLTKGKFIAKV